MISMVTCIYNRAALFNNTLASISRQQHKYAWEIIVIDDGSTDDLNDVIRQWKDLPIRLFRTGRKGYKNVAWPQNCGIRQAKGEHILYCSPEVLHYGPTFDIMHCLLDENDMFIFATVVDLKEEDNQWIQTNKEWITNPVELQQFDNRQQLCGVKERRLLYFLGGWRKDTYIRVGGMDERFEWVGREDADFMRRVQLDHIPIKLADYWELGKQICGHHQWHPRIYSGNTPEALAYRKCNRQSWQLYEQIIKQPRKWQTNWGQLPANAEVDIHSL